MRNYIYNWCLLFLTIVIIMENNGSRADYFFTTFTTIAGEIITCEKASLIMLKITPGRRNWSGRLPGMIA